MEVHLTDPNSYTAMMCGHLKNEPVTVNAAPAIIADRSWPGC
jgi:hypothetical protein